MSRVPCLRSWAHRAALIAAAVCCGCPDTQIDQDPSARRNPRSAEARAGESDERELAHRLGAPDTRHLPVGSAPAESAAVSDADESADVPDGSSSPIEGVARGDLDEFERRLRDELAAADLAVTRVTLDDGRGGRLYVVTPIATSDPSSQGPAQAGMALRRARLVFAAIEPGRSDRVHLAYLPAPRSAGPPPAHDSYDRRVDAAIHRAAEG